MNFIVIMGHVKCFLTIDMHYVTCWNSCAVHKVYLNGWKVDLSYVIVFGKI